MAFTELKEAAISALRAALLAGLAALAGCAPLLPASPTPSPTTIPYACAFTGPCGIVTPPCIPAVTTPQGLAQGTVTTALWYSGVGVPRNTAAIVGFPPLLPTEVPRGAGWYKLQLLQHQSVPGAHPLLHAGYGFLPPRTFDPPDLFTGSIIGLDESIDPLQPLDFLAPPYGYQLVIEQQASTMVGSLPAMIYHVSVSHANSTGDAGEQLLLLFWRSGRVTLRLVAAAAGGVYVVTADPPHEEVDIITAWSGHAGEPDTGPRDAVLERMAASVQPYKGYAG